MRLVGFARAATLVFPGSMWWLRISLANLCPLAVFGFRAATDVPVLFLSGFSTIDATL